LNLILAIEAIQPPLAGIGRYAWELATRLPQHSDIDSVRFMADGQWKMLPDLSLSNQNASPATPEVAGVLPSRRLRNSVQGILSSVRQRAGRFSVVANAYGKIMPMLAANRLNQVSDAIFHGPNYFVPKTHLPTVLTVHDLSIYRYPKWHPKARVERMLDAIPASIQRADLILTDSEAIRLEVMQEFNVPPEQVRTVLLGVGEEFHPRSHEELKPVLQQFGLQPDTYCLFVSTIEPRKNLTNLLAAYRELPLPLRARYPLVLTGGRGWQSDAIHGEIARAQGEGWLHYLGFVDQHWLPFLYAGCRLFAYPSWYEGFGLPIAEAMASGVPVLTSNCSSMPEVAGGAALLVEPADVSSIRVNLQQGLEDEAWRLIAKQVGLQRAAELTWDACVHNTASAYRQVQQACRRV
jgi:glycosyltransferase involved in cell wall biosynthesis